MIPVAVILYFVFLLVGALLLFLLLGTLWLCRSLPQRDNPFLLNLLVTTSLAGFPPSILYVNMHE